ncbi:hypothetical protein BJ912DRAFT_852259, partial [Pholiota molesta]
PAPSLALKIEFGGGLELLFGGQRTHRITLPALVPADNSTPLPLLSFTYTIWSPDAREVKGTKAADVEYLIHWMRDRMLTERPELFMEGATVRPGILVLINDTDWELEGEGEYALKDGDEVVFISTLHGG